MIDIPKKISLVRIMRDWLDSRLIKLPWPKVNPSYISFVSLVFSIFFVFIWLYGDKWLAAFILFLGLTLDWIDGLVARKYHEASSKGWMIDVLTDRLSEGIIFSYAASFYPWFSLFLINCLLSFLSFKIKRHLIMPLRQLFLVYIFFLLIF